MQKSLMGGLISLNHNMDIIDRTSLFEAPITQYIVADNTFMIHNEERAVTSAKIDEKTINK